jgi:hypothetical protein
MGRGSVGQDRVSLEDGWQVHRIFEKSVSVSAFEAVVSRRHGWPRPAWI